jgi:hypothetical protein
MILRLSSGLADSTSPRDRQEMLRASKACRKQGKIANTVEKVGLPSVVGVLRIVFQWLIRLRSYTDLSVVCVSYCIEKVKSLSAKSSSSDQHLFSQPVALEAI